MKKGSQLVVELVEQREFLTEYAANNFAELELFAGNQISKRMDMKLGKWVVNVFETNEAVQVA